MRRDAAAQAAPSSADDSATTGAAALAGPQRWFLYPPDTHPMFSPIATSYAWLLDVYPTLPQAERPLECVLSPGEVLYLPHGWWHATLNFGESVFISVFV